MPGKLFLSQQKELFMIALGFFTRIPVSGDLDFSQDKLNRASRYFSLVGWVVGLICASVFYFTEASTSKNIAVLLSMGVGLLITGCFHEDGLADSADGLGGGWTKDQKLEIMKDSRLGTYGAVTLWIVLMLKFALLTEVSNTFMAILLAHPLSRMLATGIIFSLPYVTDSQRSKVKPLAESNRIEDFIINAGIACAGLLLILPAAFYLLSALLISAFFIRWFLRRQIGGFTGDTLGATQQLGELVIFLVLLLRGL